VAVGKRCRLDSRIGVPQPTIVSDLLRWNVDHLKSDMNRFILTGGPGTGKSTVLNELHSRGFRCVEEVARKVIRERIAAGLAPRPDAATFAREIFQRDAASYDSVAGIAGPVFFDRGLVDSLLMLFECGAIEELDVRACLARKPFAKTVFLFPPWREIFRNDSERDQTFDDCLRVDERICQWYERLEFKLIQIPHGTATERTHFILDAITRLH